MDLARILPTRVHHFRPAGGRLKVVDGDVNHLRRDGGRHSVSLIEDTELPHAFEVSCSCGEQTWTPWGEEMATELAAMHLWEVGAPPRGKVYL
jgi:hypothetical protein